MTCDIIKFNHSENSFDIIICHDVLEHISDKEQFLAGLKRFLSKDGIIFFSFPAWQTPFGGHQQICRSWLASHSPFIHLLPKLLYVGFLRLCNEKQETIKELRKHGQKCSKSLFRKVFRSLLWNRESMQLLYERRSESVFLHHTMYVP